LMNFNAEISSLTNPPTCKPHQDNEQLVKISVII